MQRVTRCGADGGGGAGGLRRDARRCRARAWRRRPSGTASPPSCGDLAPRNRELLAVRDRMQARDRRLAPGERRALGHGRLSRLPDARSAIWSPEGPDFRVETTGRRSGDRRDLGAAAGGAGDERALRAERRQRPLGVALRRALRHRRHPRGRRPGARRRLQPGARRGGDRLGAGVPRRRRCRSRRELGGGARASRWRTARWRSALDGGADGGLRAAASSSRATSATRRRRGRCSCCATTGSHRVLIDAGHRDRAGRSGAYLRRLAGGGGHRDHGLRGFGRRGRCRGQGRRSIATGSG